MSSPASLTLSRLLTAAGTRKPPAKQTTAKSTRQAAATATPSTTARTAKTTPKPAVVPATPRQKTPVAAPKSAKPVKEEKEVKEAAKPEKVSKPKKAKLIRDSFTMPEHEYAALGELKKRLLPLGVAAKKSELLRAGVALLAKLDDQALGAALAGVEVIKTGRPARNSK